MSMELSGFLFFEDLPEDVQFLVFTHLDLESLMRAAHVSKHWNSIISETALWKALCERDFPEYLYGSPAVEEEASPSVFRVRERPNYQEEEEEQDENEEEWRDEEEEQTMETDNGHVQPAPEQQNRRDELPSEENNVDHIEEEPTPIAIPAGGLNLFQLVFLNMQNHYLLQPNEDPQEESPPSSDHTNTNNNNNTLTPTPNNPPANQDTSNSGTLPLGLSKMLNNEVRNWKQYYQFLYNKIDLNGLWDGNYSHGTEVVKILQEGYDVNATKVTGDVNVPAGKPTFRVRMFRDGKSGKGNIHLADVGYQNPRWGEATLEIEDGDHISVTWYYTNRILLINRHAFLISLTRRKDGVDEAALNQTTTVTPNPLQS